jgi:hypothetical protein
MSADRPRRIWAGRYEFRGRTIVRTTTGHPMYPSGKRIAWEVGYFDRDGIPTIDGSGIFPTLRDAVQSIIADES